jgi:hypothetical protein
VIHERQRLALRFESGHHLRGVHPRLDDLERDLASYRSGLLGEPHLAHPALAGALQQAIRADAAAGRAGTLREREVGVEWYAVARVVRHGALRNRRASSAGLVRLAAPLAAWQNAGVDFAAALDKLEAFMAERSIQYAVAGGVALAAYGHPRLTLDLDIVTERRAQDALVPFMESEGYATLYRSSGFSNHRHPDPRWGRVDFIYVGGDTATRLFAGLRMVDGPGARRVRVPCPEHLIAMKVQAIRNAPERTWQEMVDIGYLLTLPETDREEVRGYFARADLLERWHELERAL